MANRHFAGIGDVWKHLPLGELLSSLAVDEYWESHAGCATYPLSPSEARDYGAYRVLEQAECSAAVARSAYAQILRAHAAQGRYPGTPQIALELLGRSPAHLLFCDTDPDSVATITQAAHELGIDPSRLTVSDDDGVMALSAALDAVEEWDASGVFVLIDPHDPFGDTDSRTTPLDLFFRCALAGARALLWYGFETLEEQRGFMDHTHPVCTRHGLEPTDGRLWRGEVYPAFLEHPDHRPDPALIGAGLICANLPPTARAACEEAGRAMEDVYRDAEVGGFAASITFRPRKGLLFHGA